MANPPLSYPNRRSGPGGPWRCAIPIFEKRSTIKAEAARVFAWHGTPDALTRLIPPWEKVTVEKAARIEVDGDTAVLLIHAGPLRLRWIARHSGYEDHGREGGVFIDTQVRGPFARWQHVHRVTRLGDGVCELHDRIEYGLPLGWLGELVCDWAVRRKLHRMFLYRHEATTRAVCDGN